MFCKNILITGSSRGLGFQLVKQLVESSSPPGCIIAACRSPEKAAELQSLQSKSNDRLKIIQLDVTDFNQFGNFKQKVGEIVGSDGLNVVFNNAGVWPKSSSLNSVTWSQMEETVRVNTIAPLFVTQTLLPYLKTASKKIEGNKMNMQRAAIVNMSAHLASIDENNNGGFYSYRASKCALNAISKSMCMDLKRFNIMTVCVHPGWVQTDMGGKSAPLTPEHSVSNMINTLSSLTEEHNGAFLTYDGKPIPW